MYTCAFLISPYIHCSGGNGSGGSDTLSMGLAMDGANPFLVHAWFERQYLGLLTLGSKLRVVTFTRLDKRFKLKLDSVLQAELCT